MTSSIFYGPPGCGKNDAGLHHRGHDNSAFVQLNAVTSGVADVRQVIRRRDRRSLLRAGDVSAAGRMSPVEQVAERQHPARHRARRGALHRPRRRKIRSSP